MNFIQTFKMNPRLALVTVAKGVGKHALMGLAEGILYAPAMAAIMPVLQTGMNKPCLIVWIGVVVMSY